MMAAINRIILNNNIFLLENIFALLFNFFSPPYILLSKYMKEINNIYYGR